MKRVLLALSITTAFSTLLHAQTTPFDMSGERPAGAVVQPPPAPAAPSPAPATPPAAPSQPAPAAPPAIDPIAPVRQTPSPVPTTSPPQAPTTMAQPGEDAMRRYILPFGQLSLAGEADSRTWTLYLTPDQAKSAASLHLSYQNSIVVAPEASSLALEINNIKVGETPVSSSETVTGVDMAVPAGVLQAGANVVSLKARQRHRTDCTIQSTYDLWTDIDPSKTYLTFKDAVANRLSSVDDIYAVGLDGAGATRIDIVAPGLSSPSRTDTLLRLAQGLALRAQMPNQNIAFHTSMPATRKAGTLTVIVGTGAEIEALLPALPKGAATGPSVSFETSALPDLTPLVISGPTQQAVQSAVETLTSVFDIAPDTVRSAISTKAWHTPDAPLVLGDTRIPFSQLGIRTSEFAGRRLRTDFMVAMPSDFYANAYGEAVILLDAAYSPAVLPGSHIDVYVNGDIASTMPISTEGGGILSHLPISVTLRHFVPGANRISIEAVLLTEEDKVCAQGTPAQSNPRFALFDTSEFHMPDFARIGTSPDLGAMSGTAQPYRRSQVSAIYLDRLDTETLSTAATLAARLAVAAGHPIPLESVASPTVLGDRDAIIVGTMSQLPQPLLAQLDITSTGQTTWGSTQNTAVQAEETDTLFNDWRQKVNSSNWQGQVSKFETWLKTNFDISMDSLRFLPGAEEPFWPSDDVSFMIVQGLSPSRQGTWTLATAPSPAALQEGMAAMTQEARWNMMSGRVSTFDGATGKVQSVAARRTHMTVTQPFSISNWRLIAANWLSTNILYYALVFVVFFALLGIVTTVMLRSMGRER